MHALGDAVGAPHERIGKRGAISLDAYTGVVSEPIIRNSRWQGRRVSVVGQITDDHEMLCALLQSILTNDGTYAPDNAALAYMDLATNAKNPFLGKNTRALFKSVKTLRGYRSRRKKIFAPGNPISQSNGALMRSAPLAALATDDESDKAARDDAGLSNPTPIAIDANRVYVRALRALLRGKDPLQVQAAAIDWSTVPAVRKVLQHARGTDKRDVGGASKGWVLHALWSAFRALSVLHATRSAQDTLDWVICLGGDTDTNGAITGAIIGAHIGHAAMQQETRTLKNILIVLAADTTLGDFPRPPKYYSLGSQLSDSQFLADRFEPIGPRN